MKLKIAIITFLLAAVTTTFAQDRTEKEIDSKIEEVTVYFQGAQIKRAAKFSAEKGKKYRIVIGGIETGMVRSSLQLKAPEGLFVDQINEKVKYIELENHDIEAKSINSKIDELNLEMEDKNDQIALISVQRNMLNENRNLSQTKSGMTVEAWISGVAFYEQKTTELTARQRKVERESLKLQERIQTQLNRLEKITGVSKKKTKEIIVEATCSKSISNATFELSFLIPDASWAPKYDLRMNGIDKPMKLDVKAEIMQNSGMDWNNIDLTLTSEDPFISAERPHLMIWNPENGYRPKGHRPRKIVARIGYGIIKGMVTDQSTGEPIPFSNIMLMDGDQNITGTTTNFEGLFILKNVPVGNSYSVKATVVGYSNRVMTVAVYANQTTQTNIQMHSSSRMSEVVVTGYNALPTRGLAGAVTMIAGVQEDYDGIGSIRGARSDSSYIYVDGVKVRDKNKRISNASTITRKTTRVNYKLKGKRSISSSNEPQTTRIDELFINAKFDYYTAPVELSKAFLVSEILGWEEFNLLNGVMNLHVDGTFIGESTLNAGQIGDTLILSMGTDVKVLVERTQVKDKTKKSVLGNKKYQEKTFNLKVKNNRFESIKIKIQDQIPVSSNKEIVIDLIEAGGGTLDEETGIIEWEVTIEPGKTWETTFQYSAKYPVGRRLYLD